MSNLNIDDADYTYIGLFSGGKDSLVATHYSMKQYGLNEVVYCKTGIGLPENEQFVIDTAKKYGWKLNILTPKKGNSYEDFIDKFGFPKPRMHRAVMGFLKWFPLRKWAKENYDRNIVFVSGRRWDESERRWSITKHEVPREIKKVEKYIYCISPILDWKTSDVWRYVKENDMPLCPTYDTIHLSGDCLCGAFAGIGESDLLATFHPEMALRIKKLEDQQRRNFDSHMRGHPSKSMIATRREMLRWGRGEGQSMTAAMSQEKMTQFMKLEKQAEAEELICGECKVIQT